jgi:hypothetical protein
LPIRETLKATLNDRGKPVNVTVFLLAVVGGLAAGAFSHLLTQLSQTFVSTPTVALLGWSTAIWVSIGFLFAWTAARARSFFKGAIWAAIAMALYLFCWLVAYCAVFGLCDPSGFYSLWTDERMFELATLPASVVVGSIAAGAWRPGLVGSACLAAPLAWSLPEVVRSLTPRSLDSYMCQIPLWEAALFIALPTLAVALYPVLRARLPRMKWPAFAVVALAGAAVAYLLLRFFNRGMF